MKKLLKFLKRSSKPGLYFVDKLLPISSKFGLDRGTPIDRYYIENFLRHNFKDFVGVGCEIEDDFYLNMFGENLTEKYIFNIEKNSHKINLTGDLSNQSSLVENSIDIFVLTQVLPFIFDYQNALYGVRHMLRNNGVALITVAGISQISRYDMDRWGDYWRFTNKSIAELCKKIFGNANVEVMTYGNVYSACSFLYGMSAEELTSRELDYLDENYQVTIGVRVVKKN